MRQGSSSGTIVEHRDFRADLSPALSVLSTIVLAAVYYAASKLGFTVAFAAEQVIAVWAPTGIALAALLLFGYRVLPGIFLGAFLTNITASAPALIAGGIAVGNTLEALAGAWILRHVGFQNDLSRLRDVVSLAVFSAMTSTMISATIGVTSLCLGGLQPWSAYTALWWIWWVGDATGALLVAPAILVWASTPYARLSPRRLVEASALIGGLVIVCVNVFLQWPQIGISSYPFIYPVFLFAVWAALRFGQKMTTLVTLIASGIAVWGIVHGISPFNGPLVNQNLIALQVFMAVMAITGLLLSSILSERKQAGKAQAMLAAVFEASDDAIICKNLDGVITLWNKGAERLFGYSAAEAIGRSIHFLIPLNLHDEETYILSKLRQGERIDHYETVRAAKDGRLINVSLSVSPMHDSDGQIIGATKVARDITENKRSEAALKESDRRKDEFLATLAHELRNPLAPLSNAVYIAKSPMANAQQRAEALDIMTRQVQQMTRLIDDLLDVSRISHGKIELRKATVPFADIINQAVEVARPLINANRHAFSVELPSNPLWLNADATRLSQIFANLLNNAAKYTKPGGRISLMAKTEDDMVVVTIRDNGIGIPPHILNSVFNLFTQGDNSIERTQGGLGIGLMLVKSFVDMHGGSVMVNSNGENQGSEFIVRLPLAESPVVSEKPLQAVSSTAKGPRKYRVLVVDDSKTLARTLGWMVELLGHDVRLAHDSTAAFNEAKTFLPDVILLDIGLSGASGYDVCRTMRADPELRNSIFIAHTGWGQPEHRRQSKEAGFDYHLTKPVEIETLEKLLASLQTSTHVA